MHVPDWQYGRRRLLQTGVALGAILAGCTGGPSNEGDTSGDGAEPRDDPAEEGSFRLLISDQPADIGDFARLDVTFVEARLFPSGKDDADDGSSGDEEEPGNESHTEADEIEDPENESTDEPVNGSSVLETANEGNTTENQTNGDDEAIEDGDEVQDADDEEPTSAEEGYVSIDLPGDETSTVDLTGVVGERAIPVFEGTIPSGTYTKIELAVSEVDATLAGADDEGSVDVKVPSERLRLTSPFTVGADGGVDFVFDINVVKRGRSGSYNLLPVIGESGVAGRDVGLEEVERGRSRRRDDASPENASTDHPGNGRPDGEAGKGNNQN